MADSHPLVPVLNCVAGKHTWNDDPDWPTCVDCHKARLFLDMIEEIIAIGFGQKNQRTISSDGTDGTAQERNAEAWWA